MPYLPTYDSRDPRYKTPYGAVASGTQVQFTLRPPRIEGYSHASMSVRYESRYNEILVLKLPWQGHDLGQDLFSAALEMEKSDRRASRRRTSLEFSRFFGENSK